MTNQLKMILIIVCAFSILLMIALVLWFKPSTVQSQIEPQKQQNIKENLDNTPSITHSSEFRSLSQQGTEIDCSISIDKNSALIINEKTKNCFDYFISQKSEKKLEQIDADFKAYITQTFQNPARTQLISLWPRYIGYLQDADHLEKPSSESNTPRYYRELFTRLEQLRKRHFSTLEIEGLFGTEDTYHRYTLDRMEVFSNDQLSEIEKAKKLDELFNQLPPEWQDQIQQITKLEELRTLTAAIKARNGSAQEIYEMRAQLVGAEGAERLTQLDSSRQEWKSRANDYLKQRQNVLDSSMSDQAKQSAINTLRQKSFSDTQEQLRIQSFESLSDQKKSLPFLD